MGLEAATYINQLNAANPVGAADPKAQGDDHLRLIKSTLQASFPGITGAMTRTQAQLNLIGTDGTAALPSYTFSLDLDTGMYRIGANVLGFTAGGLNNFFYDGSTIGVPDGTVGTPGIRFNSDGDTGVYRSGVNGISISAGGVERFRVDGNSVLEVHSLGEHAFVDGTVGLPAITFDSDIDTGIYHESANQFSFASGGVRKVAVFSTGIQFDDRLFSTDGVVGSPAYSFTADADTGLFRNANNDLRATAGGVQMMAWLSTPNRTSSLVNLVTVDGAAANPSFGFENDQDTGLYRDTANQIAISLGGVTAGQIAQGSFNATFTGFAAGPGVVTIFWQRVGNKVTLSIPQFSGTSNSTSFSMTNLPAVIQPARSILIPHIMNQNNSVDNSDDCQVQLTVASATVNFYKAFVGIGWTAANNKGLGLSTFAGNYQQITYLLA